MHKKLLLPKIENVIKFLKCKKYAKIFLSLKENPEILFVNFHILKTTETDLEVTLIVSKFFSLNITMKLWKNSDLCLWLLPQLMKHVAWIILHKHFKTSKINLNTIQQLQNNSNTNGIYLINHILFSSLNYFAWAYLT